MCRPRECSCPQPGRGLGLCDRLGADEADARRVGSTKPFEAPPNCHGRGVSGSFSYDPEGGAAQGKGRARLLKHRKQGLMVLQITAQHRLPESTGMVEIA